MGDWSLLFGPVIVLASLFTIYLFIKAQFAKNRRAYWKIMGPLMLVGFAVLVVTTESGLVPEQVWTEADEQVPEPGEIVASMPNAQLLLLGLTAVAWIGGGNALIIWQRRRAGRSWGACLNPFAPVFRDFDGRAWTLFGLLLVTTLVLAMAALSMTVDPSATGVGQG